MTPQMPLGVESRWLYRVLLQQQLSFWASIIQGWMPHCVTRNVTKTRVSSRLSLLVPAAPVTVAAVTRDICRWWFSPG